MIASQYPEIALSFVGNVGGFERPLIDRAGVSFDTYDEVQAGPLNGVNPLRALNSLRKLMLGLGQAFRLLGRLRPGAILSTGGWASLPVVVAARLRGIPLMIYLPDIEPGQTIKVLRRFAQKVAVTVPESRQYFRDGQAVVTGYPLRQDLQTATREAALAHFGLQPAKQTILVFGGSRGARAINIALADVLSGLLARGDVQIIHITGTLDWERSQSATADVNDHPDYHAVAYLHDDMGLAFAAADVAVCRAGASILGEFPYFRLPAILIPLAYSWHYQQVNADYLADRGAAIHLDETEVPSRLGPLLHDLLDDTAKRQQMADCAASLAQPAGASAIAQELVAMTKRGQA